MSFTYSFVSSLHQDVLLLIHTHTHTHTHTENSAKQEDPEAAETHDPSPPITASSANTSTPDDTAPPAVAQQPTITVTSTPIEDRMIYSFRPPKNRILQILGGKITTLKIINKAALCHQLKFEQLY